MVFHVPAGKIRNIYDYIATGGKPDAEDWAQIPKHRHAVVRQEIREIHRLRAEGSNGAAREKARDYAARTLDNMGDFEPPTPDDDLPNDPRALAARIRRH